MRIYYKSGYSGEEINLVAYPFKMVTGTFLNYNWSYSTRNRRIVGFNRDVAERQFTLFVYGSTAVEYAANWKRLHDIFDRDVVEMTPGKLYFGDYYLTIYIFSNEKTKWERGLYRCQNIFTAVTDKACWYRDKVIEYYPLEDDEQGSGWLDFTFDFPFDFMAPVHGVTTLNNDVVLPAEFRLLIYGPAANPYISVGGHIYRVYTTVNAGELLIIDSRDRTVIRRLSTGTEINEFNNRDKDSSIFAQIPAGSSQLIWPGTFGMNLTLYQERSEPEWN